MIDPTGRLVTLLRDTPAIAAITPRVRGGGRAAGDGPPMVIIRRLTSVPWLGGPENDRSGLDTIRYSVLCYGPKASGGDRQAFALAGAVHDAVHNHAALRFPVPGGGPGSALIFRMREESTGSAVSDPDTEEPYVPVVVSLIAATQAAT